MEVLKKKKKGGEKRADASQNRILKQEETKFLRTFQKFLTLSLISTFICNPLLFRLPRLSPVTPEKLSLPFKSDSHSATWEANSREKVLPSLISYFI